LPKYYAIDIAQEDIVASMTMMVQMELGKTSPNLLLVAGQLAARFGADVIGIAACQPVQVVYSDGFISADIYDKDRNEIGGEMSAAEDAFRAALTPYARSVGWRSLITFQPLAECLASEARSADLVITASCQTGNANPTRAMNIGAFVMQVGRPVLIVPVKVATLALSHVLVAWKDTREARRAIFDALPLLKQAERVVVVEITRAVNADESSAHLIEIVNWLKRHEIAAEAHTVVSRGDDAAQLLTIAHDRNADLLVAGAYGHGRLMEWFFGGMTRDVLFCPERCSFLSH
jgi:nucleotide-binding universal stress UspA family protein